MYKDTSNAFIRRHIGVDSDNIKSVLETIKVDSVDELINKTVPDSIRLKNELNIPEATDEYTFINNLKEIAKKNKVFKSYIGLGYYNCITPAVIQRNIFENPGWYTSYTPYQAEISQGRLESLLNFQTMVTSLTGMEIANASLLDEATAAAEAMTMMHRLKDRSVKSDKVFVSDKCYPQTIDVLKSRAKPLEIEVIIDSVEKFNPDDEYFGLILQYPNEEGNIIDYSETVIKAHDKKCLVSVATDLMSLVLLKPPGEFGADIVFGSSQRFGVPLGYGGPHAAFFATKDEFKRQVPGRIIGVSVDSQGNKAYRMALQTREQHIRRDKANSNICTAQALLANMAAMYAVYHGKEGLEIIASNIHALTVLLNESLIKAGYKQENEFFFDTLKVKVDSIENIKEKALNKGINFRYFENNYIGISLDETTQLADVEDILSIFSENRKLEFKETNKQIPDNLIRTSEFLNYEVFNSHHSETKMMRYIKLLENKDISLTNSMIPLGSCTMKLNAATQMYPVSWEEFSQIHPFVPLDQVEGYLEIFRELESYLAEITGFTGVSLQPNSGAQGEYAGLMVIREYFVDKKEENRNIALIPSSAHGTNPASAVMAGMKVVVVNCDSEGNIQIEDLKNKAEMYKDTLACLMVTYPSTHGVFEKGIKEICQIIHDNGGLVYMDGANMNAQAGLTSPGLTGADVCHLNLHKTFSIPHGGGGPGMGPICVNDKLKPYLPKHVLVNNFSSEKGINAVSAAPWGSANILLISYAYIKLLGKQGVTEATKYAILNANYIKSRLEKYYKVLFTGENGFVAHEMIIDLRDFKNTAKIEAEDVAKRLMDYGFHAPTMSWPVAGTIMIEPTESESKDELDRFCDALISIYHEIKEIEEGKADSENNVLKNAPHTSFMICNDNWEYPYSRKKAAYALDYLRENKVWATVGRINNAFGDRNLVCTCPSISEYEE